MMRLRAICKWWFSDEELREAVSRIERADDNVIRKAREAAQEAKDDQSQVEVEERNEDE
jgi:acyl-CoA reductase-like NAD-dependent aldehyde dehydrogenase